MAKTTAVTGITDVQLKELRKGGWEDNDGRRPGWHRRFVDEGGYCIRHWIFLGAVTNRWCANVGGLKLGDPDAEFWTDSLDEAMKHCQPPPGWELQPIEGNCTAQAARFSAPGA